jgi:addiction module HigA family antidote
MTQADLARRIERPLKTINEIVQGKASITPDTAVQLERALGVPAAFWNSLEKNYQERKARLRARNQAEMQVREVARLPYNDMAKRGWVPRETRPVVRVEHALGFFGVSSLAVVPVIEGAAFRKQHRKPADPWALAAWLRRGEIGRDRAVAAYSGGAVRECLPSLRSLTLEPPGVWGGRLIELCAGVGVVVVFVPHLPHTYVHGATRWLGGNRPGIQMSIRGRYEDIFWFSFFHELGHIVLHGKRKPTSKELEADAFAAHTLVPEAEYATWASRERFSAVAVREFARRIGAAPGIVVGRLQHDGKIPYSDLNGLRRRLKWRGEPV